MSDPRYPGSPNDSSQPGTPPRPTEWQSEQPTAWSQQQPTAWQPQQPAQPEWQPQQQWQGAAVPPPKKSRTWLRTAIVLGVVAALVIGFIVVRDRLPSGVTDLGVGECIDEPAGDDPVSDVQRQPCNEPHDGEVFAVFRHSAASGAPYPPTDDFRQLAGDQCDTAIESYTGRTIAEIDAAGLNYSFFYPTAGGWADGDRGLSCFIVKSDGTKLIGSLRSGAAPASGAPAPVTPGAPATP